MDQTRRNRLLSLKESAQFLIDSLDRVLAKNEVKPDYDEVVTAFASTAFDFGIMHHKKNDPVPRRRS